MAFHFQKKESKFDIASDIVDLLKVPHDEQEAIIQSMRHMDRRALGNLQHYIIVAMEKR